MKDVHISNTHSKFFIQVLFYALICLSMDYMYPMSAKLRHVSIDLYKKLVCLLHTFQNFNL